MIGVGAPWYVSGVQEWNGTAPTLNSRPTSSRPTPTSASEVSLALAMDDRAAVVAMIAAAAAHGGTADINPVQDHGFMYGRDILDPDGHVWGPFWMDPAVASGEAPAAEAAV